MIFLLVLAAWAILFAVAWPIAVLLLILVPFLWLLSIPFRIVGAVLHGVIALIRQVVLLPARILGFR